MIGPFREGLFSVFCIPRPETVALTLKIVIYPHNSMDFRPLENKASWHAVSYGNGTKYDYQKKCINPAPKIALYSSDHNLHSHAGFGPHCQVHEKLGSEYFG